MPANRPPSNRLCPSLGALAVAAVLALASAVSAGAQAPVTGTVTGTVASTGGAPLAGVMVYAFQPGTSNYYPGPATTGANGAYSLTVAAGTWDIEFIPTGPLASSLEAQWFSGVQVAPGTTLPSPPAPAGVSAVSVTAGNTTSQVNASLVALGAVSGIVTSTSGATLGGVQVALVNPSSPTAAGQETQTSVGGAYSFTGVLPGKYLIQFIGSNLAGTFYYKSTTSVASATTISVASGQALTGLNEVVSTKSAVPTKGSIHALSGSTVIVHSGVAAFKLGCHESPKCTVSAHLDAKIGSHEKLIARASATILNNHTGTLHFSLSHAARSALASGKHRLSARIDAITPPYTLIKAFALAHG